VKVKAPFQGQDEPAGQGWDGRRSYKLIRFVLRALSPRPFPQWSWKFVWAGPVRRIYDARHD